MKLLKSDILTLTADKNALSVALKSSKKEVKDHTKRFEKNIEIGERRIVELEDFKNKK